MKKSLFFLALSLVVTGTTYGALWRVNNTPGVNANFTSVSAALTAASAGDTIYLEPSTTPYPAVTITKKVTIIGNGHFYNHVPNGGLNTQNAGLQANAISSEISSVQFYPGSEFSTIMGCMVFTGGIHVYASNITIKRNHVWGPIYINNYHPTLGTYQALTGLDIRQNVLENTIQPNQFSTSGGGAFTNVSIQNNILFGSTISLPVGIQGYIQNNFISNGNFSVYNFQINNNILVTGSFTPNNNVYFNNIGSGTQFGNANNNQQNISTTALFTNYSNTTETRYILNPTGPGIGAGFNGVDVGPFGGPDPYKLSGIPPVPTIYQLTAPSTTTTTSLPVTISTRSND